MLLCVGIIFNRVLTQNVSAVLLGMATAEENNDSSTIGVKVPPKLNESATVDALEVRTPRFRCLRIFSTACASVIGMYFNVGPGLDRAFCAVQCQNSRAGSGVLLRHRSSR